VGRPARAGAAVGLVLLATPTPRFPEAAQWIGGLQGVASGLANLAAIMAVALSRHRLGLATTLAAVPWLLSPLAATAAWGWWLAALAVLAVATYDGARWRALPIGALVLVLAVAYCTTGVSWNVALTGPVDLHGRDPDALFDGRRLSYLLAYLGGTAALTAVAAWAGTRTRSAR
jgi:hypothetical protein